MGSSYKYLTKVNVVVVVGFPASFFPIYKQMHGIKAQAIIFDGTVPNRSTVHAN